MDNIYDLIIIGAGPAGMSAALYAQRAQLNFLLFEKMFPGGQIINTDQVENYPGIKHVSGFELGNMFNDHIQSLGVNITPETVEHIDTSHEIKRVVTMEHVYHTKSIIIATGATWRKLGIPGEMRYTGKGVSYCATCDGRFYKDKEVIVVGGGDVAVEDAIYLSRMCKKVTLIHRRDQLRAVKILQKKLLALENIEVLWSTELKAIYGNITVDHVTVVNNKTNEESTLQAQGVFIAIGISANAQWVKEVVQLDEQGWIITDEDCKTNVQGIYAAGDVRKKSLRQVVTGVADGAIAVYAVERDLY